MKHTFSLVLSLLAFVFSAAALAASVEVTPEYGPLSLDTVVRGFDYRVESSTGHAWLVLHTLLPPNGSSGGPIASSTRAHVAGLVYDSASMQIRWTEAGGNVACATVRTSGRGK